MKSGTVKYLSKAVLLAAVYALFARLGLSIQPVNAFATLVWPPTGIALASLLILGNRFWPSVAAGAVAANVWTGAPPLVALGTARATPWKRSSALTRSPASPAFVARSTVSRT